MSKNKETHFSSIYMNQAEIKHFENLFLDIAGSETEEITYDNIKEILINNCKLGRSSLNSHLDKIKKEIKLRSPSEHEGDFYLSISF